MKRLFIIGLFVFLPYIALQAQYPFTRYDLTTGFNVGCDPENLLVMNNKLYFKSLCGLGVSNGTIGGTSIFYPGAYPNFLSVWNNKLYFPGPDNELWQSDGTFAGTMLLKDIYVGANGSAPGPFIAMDGKLYFGARTFDGNELWVTDGTAAGTMMVKDIYPGVGSGDPFHFTVCNNKLYFNATDPVNGTELWVSDGTEAGTLLLKDIVPGTGSSHPFFLRTVGNKFYFRGDGVSYVSDGTMVGTIPLGMGTQSNDFTFFNGSVYFSGGDGIYKTDGTPGGTSLFKSGVIMADTMADFTIYDNKLYFFIDAEGWATDGTIPGTYIVKDSICPLGNSAAREFTVFDDEIFFVASDLQLGGNFQLFASNGTSAGTQMILPPTFSNINSLNESYEFVPVALGVGNGMFFQAHYDTIGAELWEIGPGNIDIGFETYETIKLTISPNPTSDILNITSLEDLSDAIFTLTTIDGKVVLQENMKTSSIFDISNLPPSIYICIIRKGNGIAVRKIIKT